MATIRFFHRIYGNVHELPDEGPFPYERALQEFFEKHLRTLTDIHFLASEYSTGKRHGRRIDTLGIDEAGRPVVIEYKRSQDDNVINQGLEYLDWLEDHHADFRELVRKTLGNERDVAFGNPRLVCIASEFPHRDEVAARDCSRRVDLMRYRRYGENFIALELVYGGDAGKRASRPDVPPRRLGGKERAAAKPQEAEPRPDDDGQGPDYSIYKRWNKTSEETRTLFRKLETLVESLGSVRTDAFESEMSFKCLEATGHQTVIAYILNMYSRDVGIRLGVAEKHVRHLPPEVVGFTQPHHKGKYRAFTIRDDQDILKAEPLLRAAYDSLSMRTEPR